MSKRSGGRKVRRNISRGVAHIKATFNNTIVTITDANGDVIAWGSAGAVGGATGGGGLIPGRLGGGEVTGPNPTERRKTGTKRSLLTEGHGMPIAVVVDGANRHDMKLVERTLEATMIQRPEPTPDLPQPLCLDKGYDYAEVRALVAAWGYTGHIRSRGE